MNMDEIMSEIKTAKKLIKVITKREVGVKSKPHLC